MPHGYVKGANEGAENLAPPPPPPPPAISNPPPPAPATTKYSISLDPAGPPDADTL